MRRRKTITVENLRDRVNLFLRNTDKNAQVGTPTKTAAEWQQLRLGACTVLEQVLHETGNYRGYTYVTPYTVDESSRSYS